MARFFTALAFVLLAAASGVYFLDPLGYRQGERFPRIFPGSILPIQDSRERAFKRWLVQQAAPQSVEVAVLGSSRSLALGTPEFGGTSHVLNLGVPNATSADYRIFLEGLRTRGLMKPGGQVLIELAPWTFCATRTRLDVLAEARPGADKRYTLEQLLSAELLARAVSDAWARGGSGMPIPEGGNEHRSGYYPDGRRHEPADVLLRSDEEVERLALADVTQADDDHFSCGIDRGKMATLCTQLTALEQGEHVKARVVVFPWHPVALRRLSPLDRELVTTFETVCGHRVYNLETLCPGSEFLDAFHIRETCMKRVAAAFPPAQ